MKKFIIALLILLTGCTSKTGYGECIGAFDNGKPELEYKVSGWNVAMAVVFFEMIIPPIVVLLDETKCPIAKKQ